MKKIHFLLSLFSACTLSGAAFAQNEGDQATKIDSSCSQQTHDPYDLGWRLTEGSQKFAHQCLDTLRERPASLLSYGLHELEFANLYHKGHYWIAHWNKSNRPKVQLMAVHFDSGVPMITAGHTELHFSFPQPIELTSQIDGSTDSINDIIISWEAVFVKGGHYDLLKGIANNFGLAGRILSLESRVPENILPDGSLRLTDVYDLQLSHYEGALLFQNSVEESNTFAFKHFYQTLGINCSSELFNLLDVTLRETRPAQAKNIEPFATKLSPDPIIGPSRAALLQRNLIKQDQEPQSLAEILSPDKKHIIK